MMNISSISKEQAELLIVDTEKEINILQQDLQKVSHPSSRVVIKEVITHKQMILHSLREKAFTSMS